MANYLEKLTRRGPQFHYGYLDFFNNYQFHWYEFGAAAESGGKLLSENNVYEARPGASCFDLTKPPSFCG